MARSRRHTPIAFPGGAAVSGKNDKRRANRRFRRIERHAVTTDAETIPIMREVENVWGWTKDGYRYFAGHDDESRLTRK